MAEIKIKGREISMEQLIIELKEKLIQNLNIKHLTLETLDENLNLFDEKIGLDSIDALEIIVILETEYGIKIENPEAGKKIFHSIRTIAEYIQVMSS